MAKRDELELLWSKNTCNVNVDNVKNMLAKWGVYKKIIEKIYMDNQNLDENQKLFFYSLIAPVTVSKEGISSLSGQDKMKKEEELKIAEDQINIFKESNIIIDKEMSEIINLLNSNSIENDKLNSEVGECVQVKDLYKHTLQRFLLSDVTQNMVGKGSGNKLDVKGIREKLYDGKDLVRGKNKCLEAYNNVFNEQIGKFHNVISSKSLEELVVMLDENEEEQNHFLTKVVALCVCENCWELIPTTNGVEMFNILYDRLKTENGEDEAKQKLEAYISDKSDVNELQTFITSKKKYPFEKLYFATKLLKQYCIDFQVKNKRTNGNGDFVIGEDENYENEQIENFKKLNFLDRLTWPITSDKGKFEKIETDSPIIFTGAPGTGKTYGIKKYVSSRCVAKPMKNYENLPEDIKQNEFVQFHSSYDYSDFVEGIRPIPVANVVQHGPTTQNINGDSHPTQDDKNKNKDEIIFVRMDGIFKAFCRNVVAYNKAAEDAENKKDETKFYFIIDEINRADLGKVFGELMYCFENDKRDEKHKVITQYNNLPTYYSDKKGEKIVYDFYKDNEDCFKDGFYIPSNVVIVGSMNDIDRSVETFDFALRRRFNWVTLDTNDMIEQVLKEKGVDSKYIDYIKNMNNKGIAGDVGKDLGLSEAYYIGTGYFDKLDVNIEEDIDQGNRWKTLIDNDNNDKSIWKTRIEPILREYTRGRDEDEINELLDICYKEICGDKTAERDAAEDTEINYKEIISNLENENPKYRQIVFTGAPGTGKTFGIEKAIKEITKDILRIDKYIKELENEDEFIRDKNLICGEDKLKNMPKVDKKSLIKNWIIENCSTMEDDLSKKEIKDDDIKPYYKFVQFHSSYDYADFVEGLRPVDMNGTPLFVRMDGVFKELCRKAAGDSKHNYYFIIDEINRADLGKVFGELMYSFEYRGIENAIQTQYRNLPTYRAVKVDDKVEYIPYDNDCFKDGFYIPENVIIVGSMNDIDRSVETFDFALRRRFKWIEVNADGKNICAVFNGMKKYNIPKYDENNKLIQNIVEMNNYISSPEGGARFGLTHAYWIGPAYFKELIKDKNVVGAENELLKSEKNTFNRVWSDKVEPILREYTRGRNPNEVNDFIGSCKTRLDDKFEALK